MDLEKVISELTAQKDELEQTISELKRIQSAYNSITKPGAFKKVGHPPLTPVQKLEVGKRMRKYWAERRKKGN